MEILSLSKTTFFSSMEDVLTYYWDITLWHERVWFKQNWFYSCSKIEKNASEHINQWRTYKSTGTMRTCKPINWWRKPHTSKHIVWATSITLATEVFPSHHHHTRWFRIPFLVSLLHKSSWKNMMRLTALS